MHTIEELHRMLQERLSKKRYTHSLNVAEESQRLAVRWNGDPDKAYVAGLLHDICKERPPAEQREMAAQSRLDVNPVELSVPSLWHAVAGAWYAQNVLHIADKDVLNAIRYHTVARAGMTRLEEIVYMADLISADRNYPDVDRMRKLAYSSLDKAMLAALSFSICEVVEKGSKLPRHTIEAYNQYTLIRK